MQRGTAKWLVLGALGVMLLWPDGVVSAATSQLVTIQGAASTNQAKVGTSGRLAVDAGGATVTTAKQLTVAPTAPANVVSVLLGVLPCGGTPGYSVPAGKALIITAVNFYNAATTTGVAGGDLTTGPVTNSCQRLVTAGTTATTGTVPETFPSGLPIPAGSGLDLIVTQNSGDVQVFGYLVPAAAVPAAAIRRLPRFTRAHA